VVFGPFMIGSMQRRGKDDLERTKLMLESGVNPKAGGRIRLGKQQLENEKRAFMS